MRCKSCNENMYDLDLKRKEADGTFVDLCTPCYHGSQAVLTEQKYNLEIAVDASDEQLPGTPQERFEAYVQARGLKSSWAQGLGLMSSEKRLTYMYNKCFSVYLELLELGEYEGTALLRACGGHRGDQTREFTGSSFGHAEENAASTSSVKITDWIN